MKVKKHVGMMPPKLLVKRILWAIGDEPARGGLMETPDRVIRSWKEIFSGYRQSAPDILKSFKDGACRELVVVKKIAFYSTCEHHMLPFFGCAHVGYVPNGRIVGLSKIARVVDVFAKRLQVQERMAAQIADALMGEPLGASAVMVVTEARHLCMEMRGIRKQGSVTVVNALRGEFADDHALRAEFMSLVNGR